MQVPARYGGGTAMLALLQNENRSALLTNPHNLVDLFEWSDHYRDSEHPLRLNEGKQLEIL